jgi:hypothetical protein
MKQLNRLKLRKADKMQLAEGLGDLMIVVCKSQGA